MSDEIYRPNAGIVVFNKERRVLWCKRNDVADSWQFPQGGIENGETASEAALRELKEETSITGGKLLKTLDKPARYRFPPKIISSMQKRGFKNVGQDIYWSLVYFDGDASEINLKTAEPEFSEYRWEDFKTACSAIVPFKKDVYHAAFTAFEELISSYEPDD